MKDQKNQQSAIETRKPDNLLATTAHAIDAAPR